MIITISADGNINILWSLGFTIQAGTAFTTEKGRWKQTGPQEIQARVLDFNFAYPSAEHPKGVVGGTAVDDYTITIDGDRIQGTFSGRVFAPEVNPLHPGDTKPLFTFGGPFAGERVTLGK